MKGKKKFTAFENFEILKATSSSQPHVESALPSSRQIHLNL
jgi:hypothetical protein